LNVTPDHLDRYADLDAYAHAKGNCFARQGERDLAVALHGDALCAREARRGKATVRTFGVGGDVDVERDAIVDRPNAERYDRDAIHLSGGHNALNVAAAIAAVGPFAVAPAVIREVLARFEGLPHRTALVADANGVRWYDDSKGTNVGASVTALEMLREPKAVLIAGGRDKGGSYAPLADALRKKGRAVVVMGEAKDLIARAVGDAVPVHVAKDMDDAVALAARAARSGDAVLLSPACSSYDMFTDYKHRGAEFVRAVRALVAAGGPS
jgi:UDP-N-acetylmuramoylalanine--D-glutamate ligase